MNENSSAIGEEITGYSIHDLQKEPERLHAKRAHLEESLVNLCLTEYTSFIDAAQTTSEVVDQVQQVDANTDTLLKCLPRLHKQCEHFKSVSSDIASQRNLTRIGLAQHAAILSLLEIPVLVDSCVRSGYYEEALDLDDYSRTLAHSNPDLVILKLLREEIEGSISLLLSKLLRTLRSNIQLQACLKIVGYLRRMGVCDEHELRITFLQNRGLYLQQSLLSQVPTNDSYQYLSKVTDIIKLHVFEIVMQYHSVFPSQHQQQQSFYSSATTPTAHGRSSMPPASPMPLGDFNSTDATTEQDGFNIIGTDEILASWIIHTLNPYFNDIKRHIANIRDGADLAKLLEQCMYCGESLSRVGADFRGLIVSTFSLRIEEIFSSSLSEAVSTFAQHLSTYKWSDALRQHMPHQQADQQADGGGDSGATASTPTSAKRPPPTLLQHPPLAFLTNDILRAFNELRKCAPVIARDHLTAKLQESLEAVARTLLKLQETYPFEEKEKTVYVAMCRCAATDFAGYIVHCFSRIFHSNTNLIDWRVVVSGPLATVYEPQALAPPPPPPPAQQQPQPQAQVQSQQAAAPQQQQQQEQEQQQQQQEGNEQQAQQEDQQQDKDKQQEQQQKQQQQQEEEVVVDHHDQDQEDRDQLDQQQQQQQQEEEQQQATQQQQQQEEGSSL